MAIDFLDSSCEANIAENFRRTNAAIEGGGLPAIESGDAGKVLTVNADEDAAVWAASGGGGALVVNAAYDSETGVYTLDKKAGELYTACQSGVVIISCDGDGYSTSSVISKASFETDVYYFYAPISGTVPDEFSAADADDYPATINDNV